MRHPQILLPLVFLILCFIACGKSAGAARQELAQMNIRYTEMDFINNAREGNTGAVRLFVSAGINLEPRSCRPDCADSRHPQQPARDRETAPGQRRRPECS